MIGFKTWIKAFDEKRTRADLSVGISIRQGLDLIQLLFTVVNVERDNNVVIDVGRQMSRKLLACQTK